MLWRAAVVGCRILRMVRPLGAISFLEPGSVRVEIGSYQLVVEEKVDIWHLLKGVEQTLVQHSAICGPNELGLSVLRQ